MYIGMIKSLRSRISPAVKILIVAIFSLLSSGVVQQNVSAESLNPQVFTPTTPTQGVISIVSGPDGNLWFTMPNEDKIARATLSGDITEFSVSSGSIPSVITSGPDGNLWIAASYLNGSVGGKILKVSTSGSVVADYDLSNNSPGAVQITSGPDGNLWFSMGGLSDSINYIGKIDTSGNATEFALPGLGGGTPHITTGPDGNLWYLRIFNNNNGAIGKIDTSGNTTEYPLPNSALAYYGITTGPDGNLWFTETGLNRVASITTSGTIVEYDLPANFGPTAITVGSDGNLWLGTVTGIAKIANSDNPDPTPTPTDPANPSPQTPNTPRTGRLLGAFIITSVVFGIVFIAGYDIKKRHHNSGASEK